MQPPVKVLLIVQNFHFAIGLLARYIAQPCSEISFYYFAIDELPWRTDEFFWLARHVDVIHFLGNLWSLTLPEDFQIEELPCPTVATVHHIEPGQDRKISEASKAYVLHVTAKEWVGYVSERSDRPVILAHQMIDPTKFRKNHRIPRPGVPFRIGSFGTSGSLNNRKRLDVLLNAMTILAKKDVSFELIVQGSIWEELAEIFRSRGVQVRNLGFTSSDHIWQAYRHIDLYVCTSDLEGGPLTVLEALASGVPVVSTPVGVAVEALLAGGGIIVEKNNPGVVAEAIYQLMQDRMLYKRLADEAPRVAWKYSGDNILPEYLALYQRAIDAWEERQHIPWLGAPTASVPPIQQRERALAYARFREAHSLWQHRRWGLALLTILKAMSNRGVLLEDRLRGIRYVVR